MVLEKICCLWITKTVQKQGRQRDFMWIQMFYLDWTKARICKKSAFMNSFGHGEDEFEEHELTNSPSNGRLYARPEQNQSWKKSPFPCGSEQIVKLCIALWRRVSFIRQARYKIILSYSESFRVARVVQALPVLLYDDQYRKLQHEYKFCWGIYSQYLHTRFILKRQERVTVPNTRPSRL